MSKLGEFLMKTSERKLTWDTRLICSELFKDKPDDVKENIATQLLTLLDESSNEDEFLRMMRTI